ncbi:heptaprenyl diphosphate synthase component 1 [Alkalihalobacillus trypoxylicola]|uniref:Heptaprenyl diphosphate synthase n=1 Tax=Alkalihalobacillus trypoxylicola TaxID=519424 RepID=A0A161PI14_9BACI|nr:heptaprenyl diphosphate synthase component 1 [Alkalihalobacillus trypoxylicola]KYG32855.1 hypothetical protein AZF04_17995 [Alkalihalobacillus trypoxylicola]
MVNMKQVNENIYEIKQSFLDFTKHPYLNQYIKTPQMDEDKLSLLFAMLSQHFSVKKAKLVTLSALLLQAALDIHEKVSLHKIQSDTVKKERQLTVLAGDYYSSLYYNLLAKEKCIPMIQIFSRSIQEINESKMNIYEKGSLYNGNIEEFEKEVSAIESKLLQNIAGYFSEIKWISVVDEFFFLKRLLAENEDRKKGLKRPLMKAYIDAYGNKEIETIIESKVENLKASLIKKGQELSSFDGLFAECLERLDTTTLYHNKVAEEG